MKTSVRTHDNRLFHWNKNFPTPKILWKLAVKTLQNNDLLNTEIVHEELLR